MPVFLDTQDADFEKNFTALLSAKREDSPDVDSSVARIIADVQPVSYTHLTLPTILLV